MTTFSVDAETLDGVIDASPATVVDSAAAIAKRHLRCCCVWVVVMVMVMVSPLADHPVVMSALDSKYYD